MMAKSSPRWVHSLPCTTELLMWQRKHAIMHIRYPKLLCNGVCTAHSPCTLPFSFSITSHKSQYYPCVLPHGLARNGLCWMGGGALLSSTHIQSCTSGSTQFTLNVLTTATSVCTLPDMQSCTLPTIGFICFHSFMISIVTGEPCKLPCTEHCP